MNKINPVLTSEKSTNLVSSKYKFLNTNDLKTKIIDAGFILHTEKHDRVNKAEKNGFQGHILRFDHPALVIDEVNRGQLILKNSHDGTSPVEFIFGVYRQVCSNGLMAGKSIFHQKIKHVGHDFYLKVDTILKEFIENSPKMLEKVKEFQSKQVSLEVAQKFFSEVFTSRINDELAKVLVDRSSRAMRNADRDNQAYTLLNIAQERLIQGGILYTKEEEGKVLHFSTRKVNSTKTISKLNQMVWDKAQEILLAA